MKDFMLNLDLAKLVELFFMTIISAGITWSAKFLQSISSSINELNTKMAVLMDRNLSLEKRVERLEQLEK